MKTFFNVMYGLLLILYGSSGLIGQSGSSLPAEDSLLKLIQDSQQDSLIMEWYNELRRLTIYVNPERAYGYNQQFGKIAKVLGLERKSAISKAYDATCLIPLGRYEEALNSLFEAEKYFSQEEDLVPLGSVYNSIAAVYEKTERDSLAMIYFNKSFTLAEMNQDSARQALALNNMANVFYRAGDYNKSRQYLERVLSIEDALKEDYRLKYQLNYANTLMKLNKADQAMAADIYKKIIASFQSLDPFSILTAHKGLGKYQQLMKAHSQAIQQFRLAYDIANSNQFNEERLELLFSMSESYSATDDYQTAFAFLIAYHELKDSLIGKEKDKNLIDALTKFDTEKKEQEIKLLEAENVVMDLQIQKAKQTRWILLLGLLVAAIIAGFAVRLQKIKTRHNQQLEQKNQKISKALEEKDILLREIHHRVKNNLQVISSLLKLQAQYIHDDSALLALSEGRNRVNSMAILHQNLYKEDNLTGVDMQSYFTELIEGLFDTYNIDEHQIHLETKIDPLKLDIDTVIPLGLLANELVSNSLKHAFHDIDEAILQVSLWEQDNNLYFMVEDNGIGISQHSSDKDQKGGFGQKLIQALAEKLEAEIDRSSVKGTKVLLKIKDYKKAA
jgi:two-component sensor histidine kinase